MKFFKLEEVADIFGGQIMSRVVVNRELESNPLERWRVIIPKCILTNGLISVNDMPFEELKSKPDDKKVAFANDIVMKLSSPFDSATITAEAANCIVPSFCALIRNKGIVDGDVVHNDYLQAFLNSKLCKEQLKAKVAGSIMTVLSVGKLKDIEIPIPDENIQLQIGNEYRKMQQKVKLLSEIVELEAQRNDVVFMGLVK